MVRDVQPRPLRPGLILAAVAALSCASAPPAPKPAVAPAPAPAAITDDGPPVERVAIPATGPARGPAAAKVTIVEFSDFQCPFCARVNPTLERLRAAYPDDLRIVFRHNPLPFHPNAPLAAEAAVAAEAQGKFWEMHDELFANQQDLERAGLEARAAELGLDLAAFRRALDTHAGQAQVDADVALAKKVGVRGTPTFFIDGRTVMGAQPFAEFKKVIDDELARADRLLARGVAREQLYATFLTAARASISRDDALVAASATVYRVPTLDAPVRGGAQPKVTIIEFSDFQCPFCGRVKPTLDTLLRTYGPDLALVYRHNPLPFHESALPAALAAEAARAQGKFWEMHDLLYAHQQDLDRAALEGYALKLGLDLPRFKADLDSQAGGPRIERDAEDARRFSTGGTPVFFINGRSLVGAQPIAAFKKAIDEELRKADALLAQGTPRAELYAALTKDGLGRRAEPPAKPDPDADRRFRVDVAGAPARGPADAPVTIVEFADFQCPFCARAEETLERLRREYPEQIRFVWRDLPLPFHSEARPAAIAARGAAAQGKFWAMHDRLYAADHGTLGRELYERDAAELGLDTGKFKAALDAEAGKAGIDADALAAAKLGATGTPTFFVNGKRLVGAQPYDKFRPLVEAELKNAAEMTAKGIPRAKIYATLMKDALAVRPPDKPDDADDDQAPQRPEDDPQVYAVKPGDAPSKGPAEAPLVLVLFSDFQCPFCKRVEPTLAALEKRYGGKLRIVWKNYPLPFHENAGAAAEAALAAGAQGKFWPMHDKLFDNNTALDRPSLERYARELGLDMTRFKADLDAERYKARIEADKQEGAAVGVEGTPAAFINGRKIAGAYPLETFQAIADAELAKVEGGGRAGGAETKAKRAAARKAR
jgi:protein-disulfide isomerase